MLLGGVAIGPSIARAQTTTLPTMTVTAPSQQRASAPSAAEREAAATAAAQAAATEARLGYRPAPSSTTLRSGASPLDTAQVVNVVPAQVLSDQQPRNLDDALVNISGITQTNTLAGTQDAVMRRGFGDNRDGSIMRNGMPLVQGRSLDATVESVEVLKGPASLLYGVMDPGGIVNTISKRPQLVQKGTVTLGGSTFGAAKNGINGTVDITGPIADGGLAYRLIVDGLDETYWRNFGRRHETLVAPSLAWYGESTTVQLNYEHRDFSNPFDRGTAIDSRTGKPLALPATRRLDEPFNAMWGTSDLIQASVDHKINENWKAHAAYSFNTESFSANQLRVTGINPVTGVETRRNDGTDGSLSSVSYGTADLQGSFWLGGLRNDVLLGGDAQYRSIYRKDMIRQATPAFNIYNPVYGLVQPGTTVSAADSDQTDKLRTQALFFQDTLHLTNRLAVVGGVRYMQFDQLAGKGRPFVANTDLTGDKLLPLGGVIYKLTDEVSLYGSYTQSLKPNSTIAANGAVFDSATKPEEGVSWETGVKFDIAKRLSGTLAFYTIDKKNVLLSQYNTATSTNEARTAAAARSRGVEFDVTGRLTDNISMIGNYAYTDALLTADTQYAGNRLQNVAMNSAALYLTYDFRDALPGRLRIGAGARYVGERPGDAANSFVLPSYTVADAFASYDTRIDNHDVTYQLNIKNIFDTVYYPSSVSNLAVAMGDARRVSVSATMAF
ncbi:TonB-dependent siderophore receptor [Rhodopseudomonas sp. BAL398]|uniref:TonB-dependent siderophore receptor n=1 Tax=Rhodopseudomonas sp. BAL398 TaxID=3034676 RepID=UPI0023E0F2EF|nr:TonB-dependent siderophore receptor [Rhodopseudomonas sp. BAL398]MDF3811597.1 TonB-dependent siderophore receptor [Rhodopseudomonas sp. BAL398]WOK20664.1 TonB-dependent siderophore receptor [Rhodopseudomonas sp. BAL398]